MARLQRDTSCVLVRMPDEKWVLPEEPVSASNFVMVALTDDAEADRLEALWRDAIDIQFRISPGFPRAFL